MKAWTYYLHRAYLRILLAKKQKPINPEIYKDTGINPSLKAEVTPRDEQLYAGMTPEEIYNKLS